MSKLNLPTKQERHTRFGSIQPAAGTKPTSKELMTDLQNKPHDYLFATVECRNEESIHLHDAIAKITYSKE